MTWEGLNPSAERLYERRGGFPNDSEIPLRQQLCPVLEESRLPCPRLALQTSDSLCDKSLNMYLLLVLFL